MEVNSKPAFPDRSIDQAFVMGMALIFSIPILFGNSPAPGSIDALMPKPMVFGWSLALTIGSAIILFSYAVVDRVIAVIIEQFGSVVIGLVAFFYSIAIFWYTHDEGGTISGFIILGFAFARFFQAYRYQRFLVAVRQVLDVIEKQEEADDTGR